jgi:hypothetical protein
LESQPTKENLQILRFILIKALLVNKQANGYIPSFKFNKSYQDTNIYKIKRKKDIFKADINYKDQNHVLRLKQTSNLHILNKISVEVHISEIRNSFRLKGRPNDKGKLSMSKITTIFPISNINNKHLENLPYFSKEIIPDFYGVSNRIIPKISTKKIIRQMVSNVTQSSKYETKTFEKESSAPKIKFKSKTSIKNPLTLKNSYQKKRRFNSEHIYNIDKYHDKQSMLSKDSLHSIVKTHKDLKTREKMGFFAVPLFPPLPEAAVQHGQSRKATSVMIKNRGLTRHRKPSLKNPRVRNRIRYEKFKSKDKKTSTLVKMC